MTHNNHFDLIAPIYDQIFKTGQINVILPKIQQFKNGLFLDAGGGTGRISKLFVDIAKGFIVADTSYRMLEQVKKKGFNSLMHECRNSPF